MEYRGSRYPSHMEAIGLEGLGLGGCGADLANLATNYYQPRNAKNIPAVKFSRHNPHSRKPQAIELSPRK